MRLEPAQAGPELSALSGVLDWLRETVLYKTDGLTREQLTQRLPSSELTLAGLLNHLAKVEDLWFRVRFAGLPADSLWAGAATDPDHDFRSAAELDPDELRRRYREAGARSREIVAAAATLDQRSVGSSADGQHWDLRWILIHLVEETARHAGHADLLREAIDGATGE